MKKHIFVLVSIFSFMAACTNSPKEEENPFANQNFDTGFDINGQLNFMTGADSLKISTIHYERAKGDFGTEKGLMNRNFMPDSVGMLFVFEDERPRSFWMKNTMIALDIVYVAANKQIVTIQENTQPYSEQSIPSHRDAMYVIEVNAGYCAKYSIKEGDFVVF